MASDARRANGAEAAAPALPVFPDALGRLLLLLLLLAPWRAAAAAAAAASSSLSDASAPAASPPPPPAAAAVALKRRLPYVLVELPLELELELELELLSLLLPSSLSESSASLASDSSPATWALHAGPLSAAKVARSSAESTDAAQKRSTGFGGGAALTSTNVSSALSPPGRQRLRDGRCRCSPLRSFHSQSAWVSLMRQPPWFRRP